MKIKFRNYSSQAGITEDYYKVRDFLLEVGYSQFTYARWDWMITHPCLDKSQVGKIGIWEDGDKIVGIITYEDTLGTGYCVTNPMYDFLKKEILIYGEDYLALDGKFKTVILDSDENFKAIASSLGFVATTRKEEDAILDLENLNVEYNLPEGFYITSMKERYDLFQYKQALWKGFNHELNGEGQFEFTKKVEKEAIEEMERANVDLELKIAVVGPDENFVSYCGMWYDQKSDFAVIEPLVTIPEYRKMGLGKAAVIEGFKRVKKLGAKKVLVGSSQQFYYSIGMCPYSTSTYWENRFVK